MKRREAIAVLLALGAAPFALAQGQIPPRRIGFLNARSQPNELDTAFRGAMRDLGYVEGRSILIEYRWGAGSESQAEKLAAELMALKVDVIVTATTAAVSGAMRVTKSIPIVMAASADPVGAGLVASLARPGGNVTGLTLVSSDTAAKRLQLLRELVPAARRVAVLVERPSTPGSGDKVNAMLIAQLEDAARQFGMSIAIHGAASSAQVETAFDAMVHGGAQALLVQVSRLTIDNRARIAELAAGHRLPALYEVEGFVAAGGLCSYGPSLADMYRRAASHVDRILKGARPADLPIEQPNKYEMVINSKTAKALGLAVPQSILLRADRVIE